MGLSHFEEQSQGEVFPGRAVVAKWEAPGQAAITVGPVCLKTGAENLDILGKMGEHIARAGLPALMSPSELSKCDFAKKMRGVILATEGGTARRGPGKESRSEYFVVDTRMAKAAKVRPRE